jgi:hypothetical protein
MRYLLLVLLSTFTFSHFAEAKCEGSPECTKITKIDVCVGQCNWDADKNNYVQHCGANISDWQRRDPTQKSGEEKCLETAAETCRKTECGGGTSCAAACEKMAKVDMCDLNLIKRKTNPLKWKDAHPKCQKVVNEVDICVAGLNKSDGTADDYGNYRRRIQCQQQAAKNNGLEAVAKPVTPETVGEPR